MAALGLYVLKNAFAAMKLGFLYKEGLHLSASEVATVAIIVGLPGYLRPLTGALSDIYPLFGYHRKSYFALAWLLVAGGYFALSSLHHYDYWTVISLVIMTGTGAYTMLMVIGAVMVQVGNREGTVGRLQSTYQAILLGAGLFLGPMKGYVTQHWSYTHCFRAAALTGLLAACLSLLIPEKKVTKNDKSAAQRAALAADQRLALTNLKQAARTPGLWVVVAFVFYLIFTPGRDTAQFYYSVDVLHFSKQFLGYLDSASSAGSIVGILLFGALARRLPVSALVWGAYILDATIYLTLMFMHNHSTGVIVNIAVAIEDSVYNLCLITLAARACPPRIEGSIYGLVLAAIGLANTLGEQVGASIYDHFGPAGHHSTTHGWFCLLWVAFGLTAIAGIFIPRLPAWTLSSEIVHAKNKRDSSLA